MFREVAKFNIRILKFFECEEAAFLRIETLRAVRSRGCIVKSIQNLFQKAIVNN